MICNFLSTTKYFSLCKIGQIEIINVVSTRNNQKIGKRSIAASQHNKKLCVYYKVKVLVKGTSLIILSRGMKRRTIVDKVLTVLGNAKTNDNNVDSSIRVL